MQLFVRNLRSCSTSVEANIDDDVRIIKDIIQEKEGIPVENQILVYGTKLLREGYTLRDAGIVQHSTLHLSCRLRGGKPVKVKMMTPHLPCGPEVTIDVDANVTKDEIKKKLEHATGVPVEHQKVMLAGINQIVMGDKRTNIGYSSCGHTNGVQMAVGDNK